MRGVQDDLAAATQSLTRGSSNNGNGTVLEHKLSLLKFVKCVLQQFPFARLSCHKHQHDVAACGKDCGIIVNDNSTEFLLACLNSVTNPSILPLLLPFLIRITPTSAPSST